MTPSTYLKDRQLERAMALLRVSDDALLEGSLSEVPGITNRAPYFTRMIFFEENHVY